MPRWEYLVLTYEVKGFFGEGRKQVSVRRPDGNTTVRFTSVRSQDQKERTDIWFDAHGKEVRRGVSPVEGRGGVYDDTDVAVWLALVNELGRDGWEALNERIQMIRYSGGEFNSYEYPQVIELMFKRQLPVSRPR